MADPAKALAETLGAALQDVPGLRLALLFGSAARATLRPDSDLDVGIWPTDPGMTLADELSLAPLEGMARLRNRIAHGYASVEVERLWRELPSGLAVLDRFVAAIARLVEQT